MILQTRRPTIYCTTRDATPPKAIVGIASEILTGEKFTPKHFKGGLQSKCFRILEENGFQIVEKPKSRKQFIQSQGASCVNWQWSWSFINQEKRSIIFGEWRERPDRLSHLIFSEDWEFRNGIRNRGYNQSREHIRLIEEEEFKLFTFLMDAEEPSDSSNEPVSIKGFEPRLIEKNLKRDGKNWFAIQPTTSHLANLETPSQAGFSEPSDSMPSGNASPARTTSTSMGFERSSEVKGWVLKYSEGICEYCEKVAPFKTSSGDYFLEVHHVRALADGGSDKIENAVAVCPNCHRAFHHSSEKESMLDTLYKKVERLVRE